MHLALQAPKSAGHKCVVCVKVSIPIMLELRGSTPMLSDTIRYCKAAVLCPSLAARPPPRGQLSPALTLRRQHGSCAETPPQSSKTHIECTCALLLPTFRPHASPVKARGGGGWGLALIGCRQAQKN